MVRRLEALPLVAEGKLSLEECVTMRVVHEGPIVRTVYWHCRHDGAAQHAARVHTTYVLSLLERGACQVHDGESTLTVDATTALFYRPGACYRTTHPFGYDDSGWNLAFREDVALEVLDRHGLSPARWSRPNLLLTARTPELGVRQRILAERTKRGLPVDAMEMEEVSLELFEQALRPEDRASDRCARGSTAKRHRRVVEEACEYLNVHYADSIPLAALARFVGASPAHLCRIFKKRTGMAIRHYLRRLRLAAVLDDLTREEHDLSRIAVENGFYSHSHLTSSFAEVLGSTPSEVRRLLSSPEAPALRGAPTLRLPPHP